MPTNPPPGRQDAGERPLGPPPGGGQRAFVLSGVLTVNAGERKTETSKSYQSDRQDVSAVYVKEGGSLVLKSPSILTTGGTSSEENSSFFGLNAAVLAAKGGDIEIADGTISTTGAGANGVFATGMGSRVNITKTKIHATGGGAHGVMASAGGALTLVDVDILTSNRNAAALATDRGGGTVMVTGGKIITDGKDSPGIYSTGDIAVSDADILATGAEAAVIEGANSIELKNTQLASRRQWGVMIYQSFSGDAEGRMGIFTMAGGSLSVSAGPVFFVNNTTGVINLTGVKITASSGLLVEAKASRWGRKGANGGVVRLTADKQELVGDLVCDEISSISVVLRNGSRLEGKIDAAALTLDPSCLWRVTADSVLTNLTLAGGLKDDVVSCIEGCGHQVFYDSALPGNAWLNGKAYRLSGGGQLRPKT